MNSDTAGWSWARFESPVPTADQSQFALVGIFVVPYFTKLWKNCSIQMTNLTYANLSDRYLAFKARYSSSVRPFFRMHPGKQQPGLLPRTRQITFGCNPNLFTPYPLTRDLPLL